MEKSKIDLLPCPFCGRKPKSIVNIQMYAIGCSFSKCHVYPCVVKKTPEEAAKAWNTRASGLIPSSERMPKKDGKYLCVINGEFKILPYGNGEFYCKCSDAVLRCCNSSITYWMPIPDMPKAEDEA